MQDVISWLYSKLFRCHLSHAFHHQQNDVLILFTACCSFLASKKRPKCKCWGACMALPCLQRWASKSRSWAGALPLIASLSHFLAFLSVTFCPEIPKNHGSFHTFNLLACMLWMQSAQTPRDSIIKPWIGLSDRGAGQLQFRVLPEYSRRLGGPTSWYSLADGSEARHGHKANFEGLLLKQIFSWLRFACNLFVRWSKLLVHAQALMLLRYAVVLGMIWRLCVQ